MRGQAADAGIGDITDRGVDGGMLGGDCITSRRFDSEITGLRSRYTAFSVYLRARGCRKEGKKMVQEMWCKESMLLRWNTAGSAQVLGRVAC